ncbi:peptide ABC transporter ATP-binding protein [Methylovirgula ligni]|uniref:Peptide/nickel transport system ATP-binding protein n=1 Tax=Methylovirgula ligni TaxID=569860 RepID=A0A3D9YNG5_9HYPH|nr:ABC transporter ATP-binding protein [Methylovirgula ligni]QAY96621.1 peptide ABC transporter ATP-binding protein [Methylovirgula ligni]REF84064.1 peptide/nickel transport system ATP-binding protein [Methylovirgula ligni]
MPLLSFEDVGVERVAARRRVRILDRVTFSIESGETLGLVGESGCGKSTLAKTALGLIPASSGTIRFQGTDVTHSKRFTRDIAARMQMVFQDTGSALNPRQTILSALETPLAVRGVQRAVRRTRIAEVLDQVRLPADVLYRHPHALSGGQRQRVGIARAILLRPDLIICDEPISSLDIPIQAQILNLLTDLQRTYGLAYLFISHDLRAINYLSDRVAVMYRGRIVEILRQAEFRSGARHPYTRTLFAFVPGQGRAQAALSVSDPSVEAISDAGCRFRQRCPLASELCHRAEPELISIGVNHSVACHHAASVETPAALIREAAE